MMRFFFMMALAAFFSGVTLALPVTQDGVGGVDLDRAPGVHYSGGNEEADQATSLQSYVGAQLVSVVQGRHQSSGSGKYLGGGVYQITMKDGNGRRHFTMKFRLTSLGGGRYELKRLDCGDPAVILHDKGSGALVGYPYTLNMR